ncbi:DMT family transporter [Bacillus thuringiensis]|uniref:DMT family transporter n=1 Tax=Bacillus thuringiensis TaxID=1428 RepID=UPI001EE87277|nr:DMT family transporter [Bacillus thuringiensis]MDZ3952345.1 DMT family transporter [Bacillus thuringiensis]
MVVIQPNLKKQKCSLYNAEHVLFRIGTFGCAILKVVGNICATRKGVHCYLVITVGGKMIRKNETKYILLVFLAVCFLATGGIFVKMSELPPINTGFYRVLLSIPLLLPFVWKEIRVVSNKDVLLILLAGVFLAGDLILWNISFYYTSVANANLLANLVPLVIIPFSFFIFKETITRTFFIGAVITIFGVIVLVSGKAAITMDSLFGDMLAFLTSFFYALFLLTVYKVRERVNASIIMFVSAFGSAATIFIAMLFTEGVYVPSSFSEWWPLISLAIFSQILGQGLLSFCLGKVNVVLSSILVLLQPLVAAVYAWFLFSQTFTIIEGIGMFISLVGIYIVKMKQS